MSQSRIQDLLLLIAVGVAGAPGCVEREADEGDDEGPGGAEDTLDRAVEACRPYGRAAVACYTDLETEYGEAYVEAAYVQLVAYCVAQVGSAATAGAECSDAFLDYFACTSELDCAAIVGTDDPDIEPGGEEEPLPCEAELEALDAVCDLDDAEEAD